MKRILVIDESPLLRQYLKEKCEGFGFQVILAISGLDGLSKIYSALPDVIIMDFNLSRMTGSEILLQKAQSPNVKDIPVIVIAQPHIIHQISKTKKINITKLIPKPIKIDALVDALAGILNVPLDVDLSPCIIDVHLNENVLFIEIAKGLNKDKIDILKYRILELIQIYKVDKPKVLVIMSDLNITEADNQKLALLFNSILDTIGFRQDSMKILTKSPLVTAFLRTESSFRDIEVAERLEQIMDNIFNLKVSQFVPDGKTVLKQDLIKGGGTGQTKASELELKFDREQDKVPSFAAPHIRKKLKIAVVDDDEFIQDFIESAFAETGWSVKKYNNGKEFIQALATHQFDLVFLDIIMPELDGFEVLDYLKKERIEVPVIVLSAVSQRNTILKAISFGVNSYLIKPLDVGLILKKTQSIFKRNF
ncbi:MAG: response regulator [Spirochaetales bacterium]|nr:response regulator [Spirochaetales bacterium]